MMITSEKKAYYRSKSYMHCMKIEAFSRLEEPLACHWTNVVIRQCITSQSICQPRGGTCMHISHLRVTRPIQFHGIDPLYP
jgi:hypothetical protein